MKKNQWVQLMCLIIRQKCRNYRETVLKMTVSQFSKETDLTANEIYSFERGETDSLLFYLYYEKMGFNGLEVLSTFQDVAKI